MSAEKTIKVSADRKDELETLKMRIYGTANASYDDVIEVLIEQSDANVSNE